MNGNQLILKTAEQLKPMLEKIFPQKMLQKVKNTRSLLEAIIFHRRVDQLVYSGAAATFYSRQVIVDFYKDQKTEKMDLHSGSQRTHFSRQVIVDHFEGRRTARQTVLSGSAPVYVMKQTIKEG